MTDLSKEFDKLERRFTPLKDKFDSLQRDYNSSQNEILATLAQRTKDAMDMLSAVANLLKGNFSYQQLRPHFSERLSECINAWDAAQATATISFDAVSNFSQGILEFHGEARSIQNDINAFRDYLENMLNGHKEELKFREDALKTQKQNLSARQEAFDALQAKKSDADLKYKLALLAACSTFGAGVVLVAAAALVVNNLTSQLGTALTCLQNAEEIRDQSQALVSESQAKITMLETMIDRGKFLEIRVTPLISRCQDLFRENEKAESEAAQVKAIRLAIMDVIANCYNRAECTRFALSKEDYGRSIMRTVDIALTDITLIGAVKGILDCLADNDDEQRSIHKLTHPDHPDENYLAFLQARLTSSPPETTNPSFYTAARALACLSAMSKLPEVMDLSFLVQIPSALPYADFKGMKNALMGMVL